MHADGIRSNQFIQFAEAIGHRATINLNQQLLVDQVDVGNSPKIPVEHVLVIVVPQLHHPVANAIGSAIAIDARAGRVQRRLEGPIKILGSADSAMHRGQYLDIAHGIEPEPLGHSGAA